MQCQEWSTITQLLGTVARRLLVWASLGCAGVLMNAARAQLGFGLHLLVDGLLPQQEWRLPCMRLSSQRSCIVEAWCRARSWGVSNRRICLSDGAL
jgi:hypothetical protein